jgi:hypothetical protein
MQRFSPITANKKDSLKKLSLKVVPHRKPTPSETRIKAGFKNMETSNGDDFGYLKSNVFCCQMKERYNTKV